jgi:cytochrome c6
VPLALTGYEWGLLSAAVAFIVFALVVALVVPRSRPTFPGRSLGWFITACIVFFAIQMTAVVLLAEVGEAESHEEAAPTGPGETETTPTETTETETTETETTETTETATTDTAAITETDAPTQGDPAAGREVFLNSAPACGGCHTLADAEATGVIGPNLDQSQPDFALVVDRVTNGQGVMPSFSDSLTEEQIADVAAYVSSAAG